MSAVLQGENAKASILLSIITVVLIVVRQMWAEFTQFMPQKQNIERVSHDIWPEIKEISLGLKG